MEKYIYKELRKGEVWVFNSSTDNLPNRGGKLKTMRFGKQALDIYGKKLSTESILPVFINKSELDLLNKLWGEELSAASMKYRW